MGKIFIQSIRFLIVMTLVTGVFYPLAVTFIGQGLFQSKAQGSLVKDQDRSVGSELLAQKFSAPDAFWPRPSNSDYQSVPTSASNLGPTSQKLSDRIMEARKIYLTEDSIPYELLLSSGSGLDPHLSPEAARFQIGRIARSSGISADLLKNLVEQMTEPSLLGVFGRPTVNVLKLNLALRQLRK